MTDTESQYALAISELRPLAADAAASLETVKGFEIDSDETFAQCGDLRKTLQLAEKRVRAKKALVRKPLADAVKQIDGIFKPTLDALAEALTLTKAQLDSWARQQVQIAREKERIERQEAERAAEQAAKDAEAMRDIGAEETAAAIETQAAKRVAKATTTGKVDAARGERASVVVTKTWKAQVYSLKQLCKAVANGQMPVSCVNANMVELDAMARDVASDRSEHGVTFFEEVRTATR